jgi:hypothetical protein
MKRSGTPSAAYKHFGVKPKNIQWSWSGRSDSKVAVTLWKDRFIDGGTAYESWQDDVPGEWRTRPGFVELIENLAFAEDHLGAIVHIIVALADDENARPRTIKRSYPTQMTMKVVRLDRDEGKFRLELIR